MENYMVWDDYQKLINNKSFFGFVNDTTEHNLKVITKKCNNNIGTFSIGLRKPLLKKLYSFFFFFIIYQK